MKQAFDPGLPDVIDFDTLKLISGNSDLAERIAQTLEKRYKQWDDEEKDIDYRNDEDVTGDEK